MGRQASHILMTARFLESIVQELYRRKGGILLHNKYLFQIGGIAEPDASFCKTVIDFVLRMVNNDDAVCGYCSFNFQKESPFDFRIIQPADMIRFGEETVHNHNTRR